MPDPTNPTPSPATGNPTLDTPPPTHEVVVDGQKLRVTTDELIKGYQLEQAARRRMEEAAEQRKALEADVSLAQSLRNVLTTNDPSAYRQVLAGLGVPPGDIDGLLAKMPTLSQNQAPPPALDPSDSRGAVPDVPVGIERLDPSLQQLLTQMVDEIAEVRKERLVKTGDGMVETAKNAVDTDPILGTIRDDKRRASVKRYVEQEVQRRVGLLKEPWPDVVQSILVDARQMFEDFTRNPDDSSGGQATAIGPAGTMGVRSLPKEPIKRAPVTSQSYAQNVAQRLMQKLLRK